MEDNSDKRRRRGKRNDEPNVFQCGVCYYKSKRLFNVTRHFNRVHVVLKKPRVCCEKKFPTKYGYYTHRYKTHYEDSVLMKTYKEKYISYNTTGYANNKVNFYINKETENVKRCSERLKGKLICKYWNILEKYANNEDIPLSIFVKHPELLNIIRDQFSDSYTKEEKKSSNLEMEFNNISDVSSDSGFCDESMENSVCNIPLKKRILRNLHNFNQNTDAITKHVNDSTIFGDEKENAPALKMNIVMKQDYLCNHVDAYQNFLNFFDFDSFKLH